MEETERVGDRRFQCRRQVPARVRRAPAIAGLERMKDVAVSQEEMDKPCVE